MSAPDLERLSAYLDGELDERERAAVERELAASEEARRALAELSALDEAVRRLPVAAPEGTFERLPGRVRARLEQQDRLQGSRRRPGVPTWTWALAAALLIGVAVPALRMTLEHPAPEAARRMAAPSPGAADAHATPEPAGGDAVGHTNRADARDEVAEPDQPASLEKESRETRQGIGRRQAAPATPAPQAPPRATDPAPALADRPETRDGDRFAEEGVAGIAAVEEARPAGPARMAAAPAAARERRAESAVTDPARVEYDGLAGRPAPASADEARERREAWRGFADAHPESPLADEARVRVVEAGLAAVELGGTPEDRDRALEDARAYLARDDAAQPERVRAVLRALIR